MNFIYYRPILSKNNQATLLDAYFNKISKSKDKYSPEISNLLKDIQLHEITHHKYYSLSSGTVCNAPLWELRFIHKRIDVPSVVDESANTIEAVPVSSTQKIADSTILIYDSTTNVVIINNVKTGVSPSKIARFINHFVENKDNEITLSVMTDANVIDAVKKQTMFTSINARLISLADCELSSQIDNLSSAPLKKIIEVYTQSDTSKEYAATIDYSLKINATDRKAHLSTNSTLNFIRDIFFLLKEGFVTKCRIKARNIETGTLKEFDLLSYIIKDHYNFEITDNNRYISPSQISNAMVMKYNTDRRSTLLKRK